MELLKKIDTFITRSIEIVITIFFMIILCLVFILAMLRYVFSSSIMGANEVITMLFIYCSSLGAAIMVRNREHIKISFFIDKFSPIGKKIILTINYLLISGLNICLVYLSFDWIKNTWDFKSQITKIPFWLVEISIPIGCGLIVLYSLNNILLIYTNSQEFNMETSEVDLELKDALIQVKETQVEDKQIDGEVI
ncbi:TRAP transporter small permease [Anaeromicrobium sediminis]|uniref:Tripartite ATP-independent periplasmic transporters DctQ component domain-containing protein n=1 Tax=Anaeromicrobium sediminis TaxID=1478221 RepID=A0A267MNC6_9FIRM|nr:TRAP transporter small permease [Anaeromicrobium sediminis]PAB61036.1 hypothetical protein CCE28_00980 [Anaeromicrobium sediminis]